MIPNLKWYDTKLDMGCVRKSGYLDEFAIKMTRSDFEADFIKKQYFRDKGIPDEPDWGRKVGDKHTMLHDGDGFPSRFYFVLKEGIATSEEVPDEYGLIWITKRGTWIEREAILLHNRKLCLKTQLNFATQLNHSWWDKFMKEN
jgi:hypothetical protein